MTIYVPHIEGGLFFDVFHDFLDFPFFFTFIFSSVFFFVALIVKKLVLEDFLSHPVGTKVKLRIFVFQRGFQ